MIATAGKVRLIELLGGTGLDRIEVTSFVRPDVIPQLADAAEVLEAVRLPQDVAVSADPQRARAGASARASGALR